MCAGLTVTSVAMGHVNGGVMKLNCSFAVLALVSWVVFSPAPAAAQVKVGQTIQITTDQGLVAMGKVLSLSSGDMDFRDDEGNVATVAFGGLRQIRVVDSKANGFIGGALAGGAAVAALQVVSYYGFLPGVPVVALYGANLKTGVIAGAIVGGFVGLAIDSARMKTVFERGDHQIAVSLHPIVSAAGKGVGASVRW